MPSFDDDRLITKILYLETFSKREGIKNKYVEIIKLFIQRSIDESVLSKILITTRKILVK